MKLSPAFCVKWNKRNIYVAMYCTTNDNRFWGLTLSSGFLRWNEIKSTLQEKEKVITMFGNVWKLNLTVRYSNQSNIGISFFFWSFLHLGMFMVRVTFLSESGKVLASSERSVSTYRSYIIFFTQGLNFSCLTGYGY